MGSYLPGDILLASLSLDSRSPPKTRPILVVSTAGPGLIRILPVSSKPPSDAPCQPLSLDDFATGGLDLFGESYVMTGREFTLRCSEVVGKKGRLSARALKEILGRAPDRRTSAKSDLF